MPIRVYARERAHADIHCILLHGFGADAHDLMGLSSEISTQVQVDYLFPQAPYEIVLDGFRHGTAWFPRDEQEVLRALTGDYFVGLSRMDPDGLRESAREVLEFIAESGLDWNRLVIGGFSQGAMVAAEVALQAPKPPAALLQLSGALVAHERWEKLAQGLSQRWGEDARVPLFQSHGVQDPILDIVGAEAAYEVLTSSVFDGQLHSFAGGHTIPLETLRELSKFLDDLSVDGDPR
ncbi:alpha/beta hydrolase [Spirochaeta africana]|uniref:Putative esterase n=1 Tax=Spirochaeta africana (strain ATCC 700263 / DSM 8902 / Z-7692) TaxID=889378 RepID=H9UJS1_SPIAZ|nr:esterase [Spirochaeta africana]AFG37764.1 putative esterase [Spirochaeta africana DSM 8902]